MSCLGDVRVNNASVWGSAGGVCFAPSERGGEAPILHAVEVYDISESPSVLVWSFYFPPTLGRPALSSECLSYGVLPNDAISEKDAEALSAGTVYEVFINARYSDPYSSVSGFSRRFCLKPEKEVVVIDYDDYKGWDHSICR